YPFVPQLSDGGLKIIHGQANMITHPSMNLLRDGERQTVELQADNGDATKLHFLDSLGAKCALVERDGLGHIVNDQMPVVKTVMDCGSCGHDLPPFVYRLCTLFAGVVCRLRSVSADCTEFCTEKQAKWGCLTVVL